VVLVLVRALGEVAGPDRVEPDGAEGVDVRLAGLAEAPDLLLDPGARALEVRLDRLDQPAAVGEAALALHQVGQAGEPAEHGLAALDLGTAGGEPRLEPADRVRPAGEWVLVSDHG